MNFFGVGPAEMVLIVIAALIFVGPQRLPKLAADIARTIREIRQYTGSFAAEFNEVMKDIEKDTEADRGEWKEIGTGLAEAVKGIDSSIEGTQSPAKPVFPAQEPPGAHRSGAAPVAPASPAEAPPAQAAEGPQ